MCFSLLEACIGRRRTLILTVKVLQIYYADHINACISQLGRPVHPLSIVAVLAIHSGHEFSLPFFQCLFCGFSADLHPVRRTRIVSQRSVQSEDPLHPTPSVPWTHFKTNRRIAATSLAYLDGICCFIDDVC